MIKLSQHYQEKLNYRLYLHYLPRSGAVDVCHHTRFIILYEYDYSSSTGSVGINKGMSSAESYLQGLRFLALYQPKSSNSYNRQF